MALTYLTLMASLPHLGALRGARDVPISRLILESRLRMLSAEDAGVLERIEGLLRWSRLTPERFDGVLAQRAERLVLELASPTLARLVTERLEMRTAVAGLRRRWRGEPAPAPRESWGYGRWTGHMRRHWAEPAFRLEGQFPWLRQARDLLDGDATPALEQLLLEVSWQHLERLGAGHYFDLEAVVLYVLRWDLLDRRTRQDGPGAVQRFRALVEAGMAPVPG